MSNQVFYYTGEKRFYTTANEQGFVFQAKGTTNSTYLGKSAGNLVTGNNNNFLGNQAGYQAIDVASSNFLGNQAGYGATAGNSNFLGNGAGYGASGSDGSHFFGASAGRGATGANNSNFIGTNAGKDATGASNSTFLGASAGLSGAFSNHSIFIGNAAGSNATSSSNSIFLGQNAGLSTTNADNSIFLGKNAGVDRADTLYIDTQSTNRANNTSGTPLIYGEFDNKLLRVNGTLFATGFGGIGSVPSISTGAAAGAGSTASIIGTRAAGKITLEAAGTSNSTQTNALLTVTYPNAYSSVPYVVITNASPAAGLQNVRGVWISGDASKFNLIPPSGGASILTGVSYQWNYIVMQ